MFGITPVTVWDLVSDEFFGMVKEMDAERKRRREEANKRG